MDLLQTFRQEVTCACCKDQLKNPKTLQCSHSFCCQCLVSLLEKGDGATLACPSCNITYTFPDGALDIDRLTTNPLVSKILVAVQRQTKKLCKEHQNEELNLYCEQCNVPICLICARYSHPSPGHKCVLLKESVARIRTALTGQLAEAKNSVPTLVESLAECERAEQKLQARVAEVKDEVGRGFRLLQTALAEREKVLLSEIDRLAGGRQDELRQKANALKQCVEMVQSRGGEVEQTLHSGSDVEVLELQGSALQMRQTWRDLRQRPPDGGSLHFSMQLAPLQAAVQSLGHVSLGGAAAAIDVEAVPPRPGPRPPLHQPSQPVPLPTLHALLPAPARPASPLVEPAASVQRKRKPDGAPVADAGGPQALILGRTRGTERGQFLFPRAVAIDPSTGNLFVVDQGNYCQEFSPQGQTLTRWGGKGRHDGLFRQPASIAIHEGEVFILESKGHRIQVFDKDGTFLRKWGGRGSKDGQFLNPFGLAVDRKGRVIVSDTDNERLQIFGRTGQLIGIIRGSGVAGLYPQGVAVDARGFVFVADGRNYKILTFSPDGAFVSGFSLVETTTREFPLNYLNVATDDQGHILVSNWAFCRVHVYSVMGQVVYTFGQAPGTLDGPWGLACEPGGRVVIADSRNHRVIVYPNPPFT